MAISDESLYDLLSALDLRQISLAIEVLRERFTVKNLTPTTGVHIVHLTTNIEVRTLDESHLGHGDHEDGEYA